MRAQDNVIVGGAITPTPRSRVGAGFVLGAIGVLGFSFSLPATRLAVAALSPWFVAFGRAAVAAVLAAGYLSVIRARRPSRAQVRRLLVVALGVVVGFPLTTSIALQVQTASHGAVVIALLPAVTAVFAVVRAGERPSGMFWVASSAGLITVLGFLITTGTVGGIELADVFLLIGVVSCGLGYAEGGAVARDLGGAVTICWALIVALPVTVPITVIAAAASHPGSAAGSAWLGFAYVTVVSMFLGFIAWYAGLARGGVARIGQVQLAQPVLTMAWSALLLGESVTPATVLVGLAVLLCVAVTQRSR